MRIVDLIEGTSGPIRAIVLAWIGVAFLVTAAAVHWEGFWVAGATAMWGVVLACTGGASIGRRRFATGERAQSSGGSAAREHRGAPAVLLGASILVLGLMLLVFGLATLLGVSDAVGNAAVGRPGPVVTAAGAWALTVGVALVISRWRYMDASTTWWQRVPSQAVGVFAGASGLTLIALGVQASSTRATWPDLFERVFLLLARVLGG